MSKKIQIRNAREHNLKSVSLNVPKDSLVVITGVSGSGKSSIAFDTIFQEGQRKYVESLSAYARQFIGSMHRPDVERIEGLSPTISVDQKTVNRNPRSTVGTVTEILDHLRLLYARLGSPHCPECGQKIESQTIQQMADSLFSDHEGEQLTLMAPVFVDRKGEYRKELAEYLEQGFVRARIDGEIRRLDDEIVLKRYEKHTIELVVDRIRLEKSTQPRLREALERVDELVPGQLSILDAEDNHQFFSTELACGPCGISFPQMEPRNFSFNQKHGQCPECEGLGYLQQFDPELIIPEPSLSINEGAIKVQQAEGHISFSKYGQKEFEFQAKKYGFSLDTPWQDLSAEAQEIILYGSDDEYSTRVKAGRRRRWRKKSVRQMPGVIGELQRVYDKWRIGLLTRYMKKSTCPVCHGDRLNRFALAVQFRGHSIAALTHMQISDLHQLFANLQLSDREQKIGRDLFAEISLRLGYLDEVGLGYLSLDRNSATLSGGEAQRIRLASMVGAGLQGVTFVLDEPSIGLHSRDNEKLLNILQTLKNRGNSLIVVEHDEETMRQADTIVDVGPGAGVEGGEIIAQGTFKGLLRNKKSITGAFLAGRKKIEIPEERRDLSEKLIRIEGASENNLKDVDVEFPLGVLTCVTGVSGSGKSTLVNGILKKAAAQEHNGAEDLPGKFAKILGLEHIDKVIEIDQSPIGRTPRSNPATYTKVFDRIRDLFAALPESKVRGYAKGRFSFNVKGGRCDECDGAGYNVVEMQLLADVHVPCEACGGKRFNPPTLEIHYRGKSISEILEMSIAEALEFFEAHPKITAGLDILNSIGLGYIKLGQPSTTLSGGEAQRMKIASELRKVATGNTLYILDEPTTGLHFQDIKRLISCMQTLVDRGNSVVVIEHNLDVIKCADWVLDMGPEGGAAGGQLLFAGRPEDLCSQERSHTARFLKPLLIKEDDSQKKVEKVKGVVKQQANLNIVVEGARKHNLKNFSVEIPRHKLTVITGVSGSGKSSLAFHTLFAEGQRRFVESLSTYARRFLGQMDKGSVDAISGLAPAIAVDQKSANRSSRSTVATITELYDYFRLIYARLGKQHCPECDTALESWSLDEVALNLIQGSEENILVLSPVFMRGKGSQFLAKNRENLRGMLPRLEELGVRRLWWDGKIHKISDKMRLSNVAAIYAVIDRVPDKQSSKPRLLEALERAREIGGGVAASIRENSEETLKIWSGHAACPHGHFFRSDELEPRHFSFNSHWGACPECLGYGIIAGQTCPVCNGHRLKAEYNAVRLNNSNISEVSALGISDAHQFFNSLKWKKSEKVIAEPLLREIMGRLEFLEKVGLSYLALDRSGETLSGGESQRIRLASQIGSGLEGVLYVLDEPTVGLHPSDTSLLLESLNHLRDIGNTIVVVEHDMDFIRNADHIIDMGPEAGENGGHVVAEGTPKQIAKNKNSVTGRFLKPNSSGSTTKVTNPRNANIEFTQWLGVSEVSTHNLKNVAVQIPMGALTAVVGISGSGKSSLVSDTLLPLLQSKISSKRRPNGLSGKLSSDVDFKKMQVVLVDQSPIGTNPRSTPVSYAKILDKIRDLFARLPESKIRGYKANRFSYNMKPGRCPVCEGRGAIYMEMHFLSDVWEKCEACKGKRYNPDTLEVRYKGQSIADVLQMQIKDAVVLFEDQPAIYKTLKVFDDIGLGYVRLGQSATTLSGGEAQRMKLATELAKSGRAHNVYILDEPTTGLHMEDILRLKQVIQSLVSKGNTVVLVEHNTDVIQEAEWVIELGPEAGAKGGEVVFCGDIGEYRSANTPTSAFLS